MSQVKTQIDSWGKIGGLSQKLYEIVNYFDDQKREFF